ncbi:MAG: hypothetical protein CL946_11235 [Ectothiorhodospiraceae bacterium]|nr:hypothetical protein [Ectothiorhodospiraceae bacterium]
MRYLNSKEAAEILGVNVSTIKRWTDEGKLECMKTAGGHRKFLPGHLTKFLEENEQHAGSENVSLLSKELDPDLRSLKLNGHLGSAKDYFMQHAFACNHDKVSQLLTLLFVKEYPVYQIYDELVSPTLHDVGELWKDGSIAVAEEHLASSTISDALVRFQTVTDYPPKGEGRALLLNMSTELHTIPLKMLQHLLELRGFAVLSTGQVTPSDDFEHLVVSLKPTRVYISSTYIHNWHEMQREFEELSIIANSNRVPLFIGGAGFDILRVVHPSNTQRLLTFQEAFEK